ncbi:cell wall hydrolase [Sphingomonas sp. IC081]|nr:MULTISPECIES: cell wall hydrolase [Sphingomonadaceae]QDK34327.1 cell wall hydrolase [Sphingomonas sp. IC081]QSR16865.1 cell wall hydrolase [Novosphingobium sp. KA1]
MRSKVQWASVVALAATVMTALFSAQGSGAAANQPVLVAAKSETQTAFVSTPVVQSLPTDGAAVTDSQAEDASQSDPQDAESLAELVAMQPSGGSVDRQTRCLAGAIYFEARGETLEGQLAVGRVVINRAESGRFPASYCGVVYQPGQFSFVQGKHMPSIRESSADWREALAIARIAVEESWKSEADDALFFHAKRVSPKWRLTKIAQVDDHIFYR